MKTGCCLLHFAIIICEMENNIKKGKRKEAAEWLGMMYKALEKLEAEHDLTVDEIFATQTHDIKIQGEMR